MLEQIGFTVDIAVNGTQAIAMCQDNTYSLIFMDMEIPLLNGVEASTIIRKKSISFAPIIALTANEGSDVLKKCEKAHMNGYIRKPLEIDILIKELDKIF